MSNFSITPGMGQGEVVSAVNYLLSNLGQGLQASIASGVIKAPLANNESPFYSLMYRYCILAFADDPSGTGFSFTPLGKTWVGIYSFWYQEDPAAPTPLLANPPTNYVQYYWQRFSDVPMPDDYYLYYQCNAPLQLPKVVALDPTQGYPLAYQVYWNGPVINPKIIDTYKYVAPLTEQISIVEVNDPSISPLLFQGINTSSGDVPGFNNDTFITTYYDYGEDPPLLIWQGIQSPNYRSPGTLTLDPLSAEPAFKTTGTMAMADAVNWDPATASTSTPYLALYNGTAWVKLG